ncbi:MAG: hypothetical protein AAF125_21110, partial [Chloroflexota bacterium]
SSRDTFGNAGALIIVVNGNGRFTIDDRSFVKEGLIDIAVPIIEAGHGQIWWESSIEEGTSIYIQLPLAPG